MHLNVSPYPLSSFLLPSSPSLSSLSPWQVSGVSNNTKLYEWIKSHQKK